MKKLMMVVAAGLLATLGLAGCETDPKHEENKLPPIPTVTITQQVPVPVPSMSVSVSPSPSVSVSVSPSTSVSVSVTPEDEIRNDRPGDGGV